jgi:hypothetical protein
MRLRVSPDGEADAVIEAARDYIKGIFTVEGSVGHQAIPTK